MGPVLPRVLIHHWCQLGCGRPATGGPDAPCVLEGPHPVPRVYRDDPKRDDMDDECQIWWCDTTRSSPDHAPQTVCSKQYCHFGYIRQMGRQQSPCFGPWEGHIPWCPCSSQAMSPHTMVSERNKVQGIHQTNPGAGLLPLPGAPIMCLLDVKKKHSTMLV